MADVDIRTAVASDTPAERFNELPIAEEITLRRTAP